MRALSIRQPFAELILRRVKTVEYRTQPTRIIGEPFYIYASKRLMGRGIWSGDLAVPAAAERGRVAWMLELAEQVRMIEPGALLPTGVIVGTAVIERCVPVDAHGLAPSHYAWHLRDVARVSQPRKPDRMPQPVWFKPF